MPQLYSSAAVGTYASTTTQYTAITAAVKTYADGFVAIVQQYQGSGGALAEQFARNNGAPLSAVDVSISMSIPFGTVADLANLAYLELRLCFDCL